MYKFLCYLIIFGNCVTPAYCIEDASCRFLNTARKEKNSIAINDAINVIEDTWTDLDKLKILHNDNVVIKNLSKDDNFQLVLLVVNYCFRHPRDTIGDASQLIYKKLENNKNYLHPS